MRINCNKSAIKWVVIVALVVLACTLGLIFGLRVVDTKTTRIVGAVVSNGAGCADIGKDMLHDGGSAVDAAIAVLLCEGVMLPQSMGIGGGFVATIYTKANKKIETLVAREAAPASATENMFVGGGAITGAKAAAIPGEILGYWELHQKYGKLPWKSLFEPAIKLCEGYKVSRHLALALNSKKAEIKAEPSMDIFLNEEGEVYVEGDIMTRPKLGETLKKISIYGAAAIYDGGEVGVQLVEDVQQMGGNITLQDLKDYRVRWDSENPIKASVTGGYTMYTTPLPSSGPLLAFILNVMNDFYTSNKEVYWQRVIETFKYAYGQRSKLGDLTKETGDMYATIANTLQNLMSEEYANQTRQLITDKVTYTDATHYGAEFANVEDSGTANMNVLAPNGDAVVVTSTVNNYFGAKVRSVKTGIILNDEMDDFSTPGVVNSFNVPASPTNFIKPGKIPMSSMSPAIILDENGNVRLLIGAAGGTKITTTVASVIMKYLILGMSINDAVDDGRLHHQLLPMQVEYESKVTANIVEYLKSCGHEMKDSDNSGFAALTAIGVRDNVPDPKYDNRRLGSLATIQVQNKMQHFVN